MNNLISSTTAITELRRERDFINGMVDWALEQKLNANNRKDLKKYAANYDMYLSQLIVLDRVLNRINKG